MSKKTVLVVDLPDDMREIVYRHCPDAEVLAVKTVKINADMRSRAVDAAWDDIDDPERGENYIRDLARAMRRGDDVAPILVEAKELVDGRHRIAAAVELKRRSIPAIDLRSCTRRKK